MVEYLTDGLRTVHGDAVEGLRTRSSLTERRERLLVLLCIS